MHRFNIVVRAVFLLYVCLGALAGLCLEGDFDFQLQNIVQTQWMPPHEAADILSRVLVDVQNTLNKKWTGYDLVPFGSLVIGLGTKNSDIDCYVRIPNFLEDKLFIEEETIKLFQEQPTVYSQVNTTSDRLTLFHIPTQRHVDVLLEFCIGPESSKLAYYYFHLDERLMPVGFAIKLWAKTHELTTRNLTNYALYLLIIFYFQQQKMAPPVTLLQKGLQPVFVADWDTSYKDFPYNTSKIDNPYQLLGGFFKYYSEFNFEEDIVSPFIGRPIRRDAFENIDKLPEEFSLYKKRKRKMELGLISKLNLNTTICVQDTFELNSNVAENVGHEEATTIISSIKHAAKLFDEVTKNQFLTALLSKDLHNATIINYTYDCERNKEST